MAALFNTSSNQDVHETIGEGLGMTEEDENEDLYVYIYRETRDCVCVVCVQRKQRVVELKTRREGRRKS